jgi:murein DD-endopeptidase MepM/ murein hydrolase activator NlpD
LTLGPATVLAAPEIPIRHRVEPGDTLGAIAETYGSTVPALLAANVLPDPDSIAVGQVLLVPSAQAPVLLTEVGPGETLAQIARLYRTTPEELRALNNMGPDQRLWVGQDLLVPPQPDQPSPALPPGPLSAIDTWPNPVRQGETLSVQLTLNTQTPLSPSLQLAGQDVPLHPTGRDSYWGLVAIHALTEPGSVWLSFSWEGEQPGQLRWPVPVVDGDYPTYDIVLPPGKGNLLDPDLIRAEFERLQAIWTHAPSQKLWLGRFERPVSAEFLTSAPFGQRRSYNGGPVSGFHSGQDFAAPGGAPVFAPASGRVVLAEPLVVRGNAVLIDHGASLFSGYWHLSEIDVTEGQFLEPGDRVGLVGTTGLSTGDHLHWELRLNGVAVSPMQWVSVAFP